MGCSDRHRGSGRDHGEAGQVIVEQAIILPMMVFLILGIVQLTMIQQARICTEYAAFNAARSGIVYNGDVKKMERAAFFSILPTLGRSDSWGVLWKTAFKPALMAQFGPDLADLLGLDALSNMKMVQVKILDHPSPQVGDRLGIIDQQSHLNRKQLDFDDWRTTPALANQLTIRVRYYYKMRIPFANWFLQYMWMAQHADAMAAYGGLAFLNPKKSALGSSVGSHKAILVKATATMGSDDQMNAVILYRGAGEYRIPINTYYTMRMQSNLYLKNLQGN